MTLSKVVARRAGRRLGILASLLLGLGMTGVTSAAAQTELGGFQVSATAAAFSFVYNQPSFGVSTSPCPTLPFDLSRTSASAESASGHALGSVAWPCDFIANVLPLAGEMIPPPFGPQELPAYPVRAETFYPQGPSNQESGAPAAQMAANSVEGYSFGSADFGSLSFPGIMVAGQVTSTSEATRTPSGTLSTASVAMHDVDILDGTVHVESMKVTVTAESDTETAKVSGGVTYGGVTVLGEPAVVDADGVHFQPQPPESQSGTGGGQKGVSLPGAKSGKAPSVGSRTKLAAGPTPSPSPTASPTPEDGPVGEVVNPIFEQGEEQIEKSLEELGIEFTPETVIDVVEGASGSREVSGIGITINGETVQPYVDKLPEPIREQVEQQMTFDQTITIILGSASASAAASPAFVPGLTTPVSPSLPTGGILPPLDFGGTGFDSSGLPTTTGGLTPSGRLATATGLPITALLIALAMGLAAVGAGGLRRFAEAATTAPAAVKCELETR